MQNDFSEQQPKTKRAKEKNRFFFGREKWNKIETKMKFRNSKCRGKNEELFRHF